MKIWLIIKIIAGLSVAGVVTFTAMLTYHITVKPLDGIFEKLLPEAGNVIKVTKEEDFAKALEAAEMPDFEPGNKTFQEAHELIALGKIAQGREKLMAIINVFPGSPAAPTARRVVSMMNLDEILSSSFKDGKDLYKVKSGDSYFAIAGREKTSLDILMYLNGMMELKSLRPGDELLLMPLNYRIVIDSSLKSVALWDGPKFICEYPILKMNGVSLKAGKTAITSKQATLDGKNVSPTASKYRSTSKSIQLKNPSIRIFPFDETEETSLRGIYLKESDLEELFLLTRTGNEVEIRTTQK
ncbi:MAG: LysM peptidoglycan-binding domain-containing protein [Akkermansiaceae bacterium]